MGGGGKTRAKITPKNPFLRHRAHAGNAKIPPRKPPKTPQFPKYRYLGNWLLFLRNVPMDPCECRRLKELKLVNDKPVMLSSKNMKINI